MPGAPSFISRLLAILLPTRAQALGSTILALLILIASASSALIRKLGIPTDQLNATQNEFHTRFDVILRSNIASQVALVTFWATIGLVAYLICWGVYNAMIEARNEVTLNTAYTNRGHWRGPFQTLGLKAVCATGLIGILSSLWWGVSLWVTVFLEFINDLSSINALFALLAILGFGAQLYLCLAFAQLTFTPWYRSESFTDV